MANRSLYKILIVLLGIIIFRTAHGAESRIHLLYFFSATCPHCKQTTPVVSELSRDYSVQGLLYGKEDPGSLIFPVRKGTKEEKARYGLEGVPVLVVLMDGKTKQVLNGEYGIKDARAFLKAFEKGAMTVSEAADTAPQGELMVTGWMQNRGYYFHKDAKFVLTDRQKYIFVNPWLPKEAVKSKFKKTRPRLMSDVLGKPVVLKGTLVKADAGAQFQVKEEIILE